MSEKQTIRLINKFKINVQLLLATVYDRVHVRYRKFVLTIQLDIIKVNTYIEVKFNE